MRAALCIAVAVAACACAASHPVLPSRDVADANDTGALVAPSSDEDREVLAVIAGSSRQHVRRSRDLTITVEPPYQSASGRVCRIVHLDGASRRPRERLACSNGTAWFFVPEVFVGSSER